MPHPSVIPAIIAAAAGVHFWCQPSLTKCFDFYSWLISAEAVFPLIVLGLTAICLTRIARQIIAGQPVQNSAPAKIPYHEYVAIAAFTLIPVFAQLLALAITNAFTDRYALPALIGISLMIAILVDWRVWGRLAAIVPTLVLLCWAPFVQVLVYRRVATERNAYTILRNELGATLSYPSSSPTAETICNCTISLHHPWSAGSSSPQARRHHLLRHRAKAKS